MFPPQLLHLTLLSHRLRPTTLVSLLVYQPASDKVDRRCCCTHACQSETRAETCMEPRCLFEQEYVGRNECTGGTKVDDCSDGDGPLVSAACVDAHPYDADGHGHVGPACHQEHARITSLGRRRVDDLNNQTRS